MTILHVTFYQAKRVRLCTVYPLRYSCQKLLHVSTTCANIHIGISCPSNLTFFSVDHELVYTYLHMQTVACMLDRCLKEVFSLLVKHVLYYVNMYIHNG